MEKTTRLFTDFQPVTKAEWLAKVEKDLKGKPISDLDFDIGEISLSPFYHSEDLPVLPKALPLPNGWEIGEDIFVKDDLIATNKELLGALEGGVNAPRLILNKNISGEHLAVILENVNLEMISTHFYFTNKNASPQSLLPHFLKYISSNKLNGEKIIVGFNWSDENAVDPLEMARLLEQLKGIEINIKALTVNGVNYFSENNLVNELADILIKGESFLQKYDPEKYTPGFINQHLQFSMAIGKNYFLQIAKLRALRLLWANVMKAYRIESEMPPIETHLAPSCQSADDNTNMIAATTQAMSAIIGGADRLTVLPSDAHGGSTAQFTRRIARNVQHILEMESHFGNVADPAAGSYFVEKLTACLAENAWRIFQEN